MTTSSTPTAFLTLLLLTCSPMSTKEDNDDDILDIDIDSNNKVLDSLDFVMNVSC